MWISRQGCRWGYLSGICKNILFSGRDSFFKYLHERYMWTWVFSSMQHIHILINRIFIKMNAQLVYIYSDNNMTSASDKQAITTYYFNVAVQTLLCMCGEESKPNIKFVYCTSVRRNYVCRKFELICVLVSLNELWIWPWKANNWHNLA